MAFERVVSAFSFPCTSTKFKLMLAIVTLLSKTSIGTVAEKGQVTITNGEIPDEIGNPGDLTENGSFHSLSSPDHHLDDFIAYKRHMGAIAALSGPRPLIGSKYFIPPSKKHVGSIAQSAGRPIGRKLELTLPMKSEMYKRHLGSLRALTGGKQKPLTRSLKESSGYQFGPESELEIPQMSNIVDSESLIVHEEPLSNTFDPGLVITPEEIQSYPEAFFDVYSTLSEPKDGNSFTASQSEYANEPSFDKDFLRRNFPQVEGTGNEEFQSGESSLEDGAFKSKRFLGPLARGGWFPRHFRGIVSENSFGKRHIGALARLGWMPHAKGNSRLMLDEQRGEIGLKRNDASRRRMLYHFTAPSLWTSPRGK